MTIVSNADERHVVIRVILAAGRALSSPLGMDGPDVWACFGLLPAVAIREAEWIDLSRVRVNLEWVVFSVL